MDGNSSELPTGITAPTTVVPTADPEPVENASNESQPTTELADDTVNRPVDSPDTNLPADNIPDDSAGAADSVTKTAGEESAENLQEELDINELEKITVDPVAANSESAPDTVVRKPTTTQTRP